eukprot:2603095-Prymnesium_polylepis.1
MERRVSLTHRGGAGKAAVNTTHTAARHLWHIGAEREADDGVDVRDQTAIGDRHNKVGDHLLVLGGKVSNLLEPRQPNVGLDPRDALRISDLRGRAGRLRALGHLVAR